MSTLKALTEPTESLHGAIYGMMPKFWDGEPSAPALLRSFETPMIGRLVGLTLHVPLNGVAGSPSPAR